MEEIFELIKAFNRLKEKIVELLLKSPATVETRQRPCLQESQRGEAMFGDKPMPCLYRWLRWRRRGVPYSPYLPENIGKTQGRGSNTLYQIKEENSLPGICFA